MAKTRKRTETETGDVPPESPTSRPDTAESQSDASSNGHADRVAARAYELYLARGGTHGSDWDDWLTAEREIMGRRSESEER